MVTVLSVCTLSLFIYSELGAANNYIAWQERQSQIAAIKKAMLSIRTPQQVIAKLQTHLETHQKSSKGWMLLGRLHLSVKNYDAAVAALHKAYELKKDDPEIMIQYVEARFIQHNRKLSQQDIKILKQLLIKQPKHAAALNILAVNAFLEKRYQEAIDSWQDVLSQTQPGSDDQKAILVSIAKAQKALNPNYQS